MNVAAAIPQPVRLAQLPRHKPGTVAAVDWNLLSEPEGRRLRELGLDEGVEVEMLHRAGLLGRGPVACRIGRMTVALRRHVAAAIHVSPKPGR
ncbi:ferrous iron transport protein A [Sphingomonas naasensis]|uniref:Ferrous iron transport protein A n=1 Tax=Sphingomonas naasensis TaxID=1344951 RepID=A0A4S1WDC4_9SPHN|nr:FeoA family protein [Sphingomonas naasensis]NIJ21221.1 ferrous iron transport protein A [Sphingomonas naasensis]TGX38666.1 ferrous iron transport protein A [Sphingomonas naasensis]